MISEERQKELSEMSDAWLAEMVRVHHARLDELKWEFNRRFPAPEAKKLVELPCTLQELETVVHAYGDHNGFHGKVRIVRGSPIDPEANDYLGIAEVTE